MTFNYDRLYVLKDEGNKPTTRILTFLSDCIIDINKIAARKVYILALDKQKFKDKEMASVLTSRGIKALPALEIRSESKIIEGVQNIINYYHQLTSRSNPPPQQLTNPMMEEPIDPYEQYYANDMRGNDVGGDGNIGEDWNDVNTSLASRASYGPGQRGRDRGKTMLDVDMDPIQQQQPVANTSQKGKMPSQSMDEEIGKVKLDLSHAPKDIGKSDEALEAALMDKLGNTGDM